MEGSAFGHTVPETGKLLQSKPAGLCEWGEGDKEAEMTHRGMYLFMIA